MVGLPKTQFDDSEDFDDFDEMDNEIEFEVQDALEDQPDIESELPAESIQHAADARRKLEEYWERKNLQDQLKEIDDWDDE